jgi:hypothetical protein
MVVVSYILVTRQVWPDDSDDFVISPRSNVDAGLIQEVFDALVVVISVILDAVHFFDVYAIAKAEDGFEFIQG